MKINLLKEDQQKLSELIAQKEENITAANALMYICYSYQSISNNEINGLVRAKNISEKDAYIELISKFIDADEFDIDIPSLLNNSIKKEDSGLFLNNPYYRNIKINNIKIGSYKLTYDAYEPYEPFPLSEITVDSKYYKERSSLGYFEKKFPFISLMKNNITWMCITPNEINTMQPYIDEAKGNVLVNGLGLGYFAYMISLKANVNHIYIVEKDHTIIDLFKKHLLPQFENKDKITIIQNDALKYHSNNIDYVFSDLWHNPNDGLMLYYKLLKMEKPGCIYRYWLEESMLAYFRRLVLCVIEETLEDYEEEAYLEPTCDDDRLINAFYFYSKNDTYTSFEQIQKMLSNDSLKNILKQLKI